MINIFYIVMCDGVQIFLVKKELNLNYNKKAIYRYTEV